MSEEDDVDMSKEDDDYAPRACRFTTLNSYTLFTPNEWNMILTV